MTFFDIMSRAQRMNMNNWTGAEEDTFYAYTDYTAYDPHIRYRGAPY